MSYLFFPESPGVIRGEDVKSFLEAGGIAKICWPERLVTMDALPYNSTGTVKKFKLQLMLAGEQDIDEGN